MIGAGASTGKVLRQLALKATGDDCGRNVGDGGHRGERQMIGTLNPLAQDFGV